jgi:hypothetical protein
VEHYDLLMPIDRTMLCIRLSPEEHRRIKVLVAEIGLTIQDVGVIAWNRILAEYGIQQIEPEQPAPVLPPPPKKGRAK